MKQITAVIIGLAVFCLTLSVFAANKPISFTGSWILDPEKSDPFPVTNSSGGMGMGGMGGMGGGMGGMGGGMGGMGGGMGGMGGGRGGMGGGMGGMGGGMGGMGGGMGGVGGGMGGMGGGMGRGGMGGGMGGGMAKEAPGSLQGSSAPMVIEQSETEIRITNTVRGILIVDTYKLDGKTVNEVVDQQPGFGGGGRAGFGQQQQPTGEKVPRATLAKLSKGTLDVKEVTSTSYGKSTVKKTFTLSKDGKVLTMRISTTTSAPTSGMGGMGGMGGGGGSSTSQKLVYNKQTDKP
jgi:hypothetical protein